MKCLCGCGQQVTNYKYKPRKYMHGHNAVKKGRVLLFHNPVLCKCGCGKLVDKWNYNLNKPVEYILGHNTRVNHPRGALGIKHTEEWKKTMSLRLKGKKLNREWVENIRKAKLGNRNPMFGKTPSAPFLKGHIPWNKGIEWEELSGKNHPNWRGGITPLYLKIRHCLKAKQWAMQVKQRDRFTCVICGKKNIYLNSDHIVPFAVIIWKYNIKSLEEAIECDKLWDLNNGRTLCKDCHLKTDTYSKGFYKNYKVGRWCGV